MSGTYVTTRAVRATCGTTWRSSGSEHRVARARKESSRAEGGGMHRLVDDEEAQRETSGLATSMHNRNGYEALATSHHGSGDLNTETALDIAGDVQIIEPRKYRFKPTSRVPTWSLRLMPHSQSGLEGTVGRSCVVTAIAVKGSWLKVRVKGGKEGWMLSDAGDGRAVLSECSSYRRYEEWGGNNRFYLGGKIMMGSDVRWFMSSNISLTIPVMMFVWKVFLGFPVAGGHVLAGVGLALYFVAMLNLWLTALTDPGIIPPNPSNERALPPEGESIGLHGFKYCETCNIFRPPRSKHCHSCNNCVDRFDHHCPWVGSCVAIRNYRFFLVFVSATSALLLYMMCVLVCRVVLRVVVEGDGSVPRALEIVASGPLDLILIAMALVIGIPLLRLWWYHVRTVVGKGTTTNEDIRGVYRNHTNTYNKGCVSNTFNLCCARAPQSRLPDLSELVHVNKPASARGGARGDRVSRTFSWIYPAGGFGFGFSGEQDQARRAEVSVACSRQSSSSAGSFASCAEGPDMAEDPSPSEGTTEAVAPTPGDQGSVSPPSRTEEGEVSLEEMTEALTSTTDSGWSYADVVDATTENVVAAEIAEAGRHRSAAEDDAAAKLGSGSPPARAPSPLVGLSYANSPRSASDLSTAGGGGGGATTGSRQQALAALSPLGAGVLTSGSLNAPAAREGMWVDGDAGGSHSSGELWYSPTPPASLRAASAGGGGRAPQDDPAAAAALSSSSAAAAGAAAVRLEDGRARRGFGRHAVQEGRHAGVHEELTALLGGNAAPEATVVSPAGAGKDGTFSESSSSSGQGQLPAPPPQPQGEPGFEYRDQHSSAPPAERAAT